MRIIIAGGGVGGLAAAQYLHRAGHEVSVHEAWDQLRTEGASLILWPSGTGILRDLGLEPEVIGAPMDAMHTLSEDGHTLLRLDLTKLARRFGHPTVVVPRGDLLKLLVAGLPDHALRYGQRCAEVVDTESSVGIRFADGSTAEGDLLIGADGHRSSVRRHLHGDQPARYTGYATWHGLTRLPIRLPDPRTGLVFHGPSGFATIFAAGDDQLQWVFVTPFADGDTVPRGVRDERTGRRGQDGAASGTANLKDRFGHLASPVPELLDALTDEEIGLFPHILHEVPDEIGRGRTTLIGDALHAVPPTLAQGVNQTLEDAWCLNRALTADGSGTPQTRLRAYEGLRRRKLTRLQKMAAMVEDRPAPPTALRRAPWLVPYTAMTSWTINTYSNFLPLTS